MYYNAQYVNGFDGFTCGIRCEIDGKQSFVPISDQNLDYRHIMALVAAGELTIAPAS